MPSRAYHRRRRLNRSRPTQHSEAFQSPLIVVRILFFIVSATSAGRSHLVKLVRATGDDGAFIDSLMSWGDFDAVASWRGVDGILTQLKTLGTYGASAVLPRCHRVWSLSYTDWRAAVTESKRAELRDWARMLRRRWDNAGPEARGFAAVTASDTPGMAVTPRWQQSLRTCWHRSS